jgi:hypothetical protein
MAVTRLGAHGGLGVRRAGSRNRGTLIWSTLNTSVPAQASRLFDEHGQHRQVYLPTYVYQARATDLGFCTSMCTLGRRATTDDDGDAAAAAAAAHAGVSVHALAVRCRTC